MVLQNPTTYYRYTIASFDILIPGKDPIDVKTHVSSMFIEKAFDNDLFPIFGAAIDLNFIQYYDIIYNKTTVKFRIRLDRYEFDKDNPSTERRYNENVFDSIFSIYIDDDSAFLSKDMYEQAVSELHISETESLKSYEFYFFKEDDLKASKTILNTVLSRCTMTDAVAYLLSQSGSKKILLSPLDNANQYSEILLPPLQVCQNIGYLEEQYGFYKHGTLYFYDYNRVYFIDKGPDCTAWSNGEIPNVTLSCSKSTDIDVLLPGTYKNTVENTYELKLFMSAISMKSQSIQEDQLTATNITIVNPKNGNSVEVTPKIDTRVGNKKVVVDNYNNQYISNMIEYAKYQDDHIISASFSDIDIDSMSPNKRFNFIFSDKEVNTVHGGKYRLSSTLFKFESLGNADFSVTAASEFKKSL